MRKCCQSRRAWIKSLGNEIRESSLRCVGEGDVEGAIADFSQAIKIDPHHPEAYVNRGLLLLQQGMKAEAERDFARSIAVKPSLKDFIKTRVSQISQK